MSIRVLTRVWEQSSLSSTELLLLLALADHANDDSICWPGIPRLAKKTRKSERQVKRLLKKLEAIGELFIPDRNGGRKSPNYYLIICGLSRTELETILTSSFFNFSASESADLITGLLTKQKGDIQGKSEKPNTVRKGDIQGKKGDIQGKKGDIQGKKGDIAVSPEPSFNRHEPSGEGEANKIAIDSKPTSPPPALSQSEGGKLLEQVIRIYEKYSQVRLHPNDVARRETIKEFLAKVEGQFDLDRWRKSIRTCVAGNVSRNNLACMIDVYHAGGDYQAMLDARRKGESTQPSTPPKMDDPNKLEVYRQFQAEDEQEMAKSRESMAKRDFKNAPRVGVDVEDELRKVARAREMT